MIIYQVEPRKMSIYREEAIDAIIEALKRKDFPLCQIIALETLSSLSGRLSPLGDPMTEAWLLKIAGVNHLHNKVVKEDEVQVRDYAPEEATVNILFGVYLLGLSIILSCTNLTI